MLITSTYDDYSFSLNFPNVSTKLIVTQAENESPLMTVILYNVESLAWICPPWLEIDWDGRIRGIDDVEFSRIVSWLHNGMKEEPSEILG